MKQTLTPLFWLWVPLFIVIAQIFIEVFVPTQYLPALHSENGPHETLQFIFALIGLIVSFRCLYLLKPSEQPFLTAWVICFCLGCAYIAGEEISWGQHVMEWSTPEFWNGLNDQHETNLHITSSWLDQKPRLILLLGTLVGGLIIPALAKFKPSALPEKFKIIYPPAILSVTAGLTLIIKIIDKAQDAAGTDILTRPSELEELFLFYFVMLYLIILSRRIKGLNVQAP
ncbi:MAG: hypothetical protein GW778_06635 [Alphaproteobacteria bacterium]|nr:hypothetical protein [Alphaproteobacteria bacterium]